MKKGWWSHGDLQKQVKAAKIMLLVSGSDTILVYNTMIIKSNDENYVTRNRSI
jgi:hypothetical protein